MPREDLGAGKLFERIQDAVIVADAKAQRIVARNPAAANVFVYSVSEALVPEHLEARHKAGIARHDETGRESYVDSHKTLGLAALRKDDEGIVPC
ncbi:MAG: hypothetical protein M3248_04995 [Actinomycetota bacterium]|nr:hypothetical protein [Actinomycetota bacterium]